MASSVRGFGKFVGAVHARYVLIRMVERAGLGILAGCLAATPLLAIALYRGLPMMTAALTAIAIGMLAGSIYGWATRPTVLQSALEADRQLGWADLLSTALRMQAKSPEDTWVSVIRAEADFRSAGVSPATVVLRRLGVRAWGGIGLATTLVMILGLFPTFAVSTNADENRSTLSGTPADLPQAPQSFSSSARSEHRTPRQQDPDDPNASRFGNVEAPPPDPRGNATGTDQGRSNAISTSKVADGQGSGASHSQSSAAPRVPIAASGTESVSGSQHGTPTGGAGQSAGVTPSGEDVATGSITGAGDAANVPPWRTSSWNHDVERAENAVRSGQLPDAYRDLVRDYFDRSSSRRPADAPANDR